MFQKSATKAEETAPMDHISHFRSWDKCSCARGLSVPRLTLSCLLFASLLISTNALALPIVAGDIVVTFAGDPFHAVGGPAGVAEFDTQSKQLTSLNNTSAIDPARVVINTQGEIFFTDFNSDGLSAVYRIDPISGIESVITVLPSSSGRSALFGLALDNNENLIATDPRDFGGSGNIYSIDPVIGSIGIVTSEFRFSRNFDIAIDAQGNWFLPDTSGIGRIFLFDPTTGSSSILAEGGLLLDPFGIALDQDGNLLVADRFGEGGQGRIVGIDVNTGAQSLIATGGFLRDPMDLVMDDLGTIYVVDPGANTRAGGIVAIDPLTGIQSLSTTRGSGLEFPVGIAIAPSISVPEPGTIGLLMVGLIALGSVRLKAVS